MLGNVMVWLMVLALVMEYVQQLHKKVEGEHAEQGDSPKPSSLFTLNS